MAAHPGPHGDASTPHHQLSTPSEMYHPCPAQHLLRPGGAAVCVTGPPTDPRNPSRASQLGPEEQASLNALWGGLPLGGQLPWGLHPTCVTHQETGLFLKRLLLEPLSSRPRLSVQCVCRLPPPCLTAHMASAGPSRLGSGGRSPPQEDPLPPPKTALRSVGQGEHTHTWGCSPRRRGPGRRPFSEARDKGRGPGPPENPTQGERAARLVSRSPGDLEHWGRGTAAGPGRGLTAVMGDALAPVCLPAPSGGRVQRPAQQPAVLATLVIPTPGRPSVPGHQWPLPAHTCTPLSPDPLHQPPAPALMRAAATARDGLGSQPLAQYRGGTLLSPTERPPPDERETMGPGRRRVPAAVPGGEAVHTDTRSQRNTQGLYCLPGRGRVGPPPPPAHTLAKSLLPGGTYRQPAGRLAALEAAVASLPAQSGQGGSREVSWLTPPRLGPQGCALAQEVVPCPGSGPCSASCCRGNPLSPPAGGWTQTWRGPRPQVHPPPAGPLGVRSTPRLRGSRAWPGGPAPRGPRPPPFLEPQGRSCPAPPPSSGPASCRAEPRWLGQAW